MKKLFALYGTPTDPEHFERHYRDVHTPLTLAMPGLEGFALSWPNGDDAPYHLLAEMTFASQEDLDRALGSAEGAAAVADLENFASGGCTVVVADVETVK